MHHDPSVTNLIFPGISTPLLVASVATWQPSLHALSRVLRSFLPPSIQPHPPASPSQAGRIPALSDARYNKLAESLDLAACVQFLCYLWQCMGIYISGPWISFDLVVDEAKSVKCNDMWMRCQTVNRFIRDAIQLLYTHVLAIIMIMRHIYYNRYGKLYLGI